MKLEGVYVDENGEMRLESSRTGWFSWSVPTGLPTIILTKEEAKARGLGSRKPDKKGYIGYVVIEGVKVPLKIKGMEKKK